MEREGWREGGRKEGRKQGKKDRRKEGRKKHFSYEKPIDKQQLNENGINLYQSILRVTRAKVVPL